jgi:hypothetical protein
MMQANPKCYIYILTVASNQTRLHYRFKSVLGMLSSSICVITVLVEKLTVWQRIVTFDSWGNVCISLPPSPLTHAALAWNSKPARWMLTCCVVHGIWVHLSQADSRIGYCERCTVSPGHCSGRGRSSTALCTTATEGKTSHNPPCDKHLPCEAEHPFTHQDI